MILEALRKKVIIAQEGVRDGPYSVLCATSEIERV
jgi:hypothetical protein